MGLCPWIDMGGGEAKQGNYGGNWTLEVRISFEDALSLFLSDGHMAATTMG